MAFDLRSTAYGLSHMLLGARRVLLHEKADLYIASHKDWFAAEGFEIQPLDGIELGTSNGANRCPLCGFSLVRVSRSGCYAIEICSAFELKRIAHNRQAIEWLAGLGSSGKNTVEAVSKQGGSQDSYNLDSCATDEQSSRA